MSLAQDRLVVAALAVAEGAWLYVLFGMAGLAFGVGGSPLGWLGVLAILGLSILVGRSLNSIAMPRSFAYGIQMMLGAVVVYLTLGTQIGSETVGIDLGWIGSMTSSMEEGADTRWGVLASIFAVGLWWRGGAIAASEYPTESLEASFRLGTMAFALSAVVEVAGSGHFNVFPTMFVFFASGLAGLGVGHLLPASKEPATRTWPRVIGGVVSVVVAVGLILGALQKGALSVMSGPALVILGAVAKLAFFVLVLPVVFVLSLVVAVIIRIFKPLLGGERQDFEGVSMGEMRRQLLERQDANAEAPAFLSMLEWALLALVVLVVLYLLARAFRRRVRLRSGEIEWVRESLRDEGDVGYDLGRLLFGLLPERFKTAKTRRTMKLPDEHPDVADVFRVYFGLLVLAEERGVPRPTGQTPTEYQKSLETLFPQRFVRMATDAFNRACYGHHPASRQQIDEMRAALEGLGPAKR